MSLRSAVLYPLTLAYCLAPIGHPAHASTEPPHDTHHKSAATTAAAAELPFFAPGLWEYRRTLVKDGTPSSQISVLRKCADPSVEIRTKMAELGKRNCRFAPLRHRHQRYFSTWTCPTPLGPTKFRAVLIVRGASGYTDVSEMRTDEHVARQRIEAARIGECPASGPDKQFRPNPQAIPRTSTSTPAIRHLTANLQGRIDPDLID